MVKSALASRNAELNHGRAVSQEPGDGRRGGRDGSGPPGTGGALSGLSGAERQAVAAGWLLGLAIVALVMIIDIVTRAHVKPGDLPYALIDESSSAVVTSVLLALPIGVALWIRRASPPLWQAAIVWLTGAALYAVLHVSGFVAIRKVAYVLLLHGHYRFGPLLEEFSYEASKDVLAFLFASVAAALTLRWRFEVAAAAEAPEVFDIRDGARIVRVPVADILAVRSAGNYVEFLLGDGRSPLMRAALSSLEPRLGAMGFVRTHRSWLVNSARMSGLRPDGSGDYTVELGKLEAPLSRRFPDALAKLRT
jgi:DNA-binding LytR/AlgR family response regulator